MSPSPSAPEADGSLEALVSRTLGSEILTDLSELLPGLANDLTLIDQRLYESLRTTYPQLADAATYACRSGGKRVRPLLMVLLARALGAESTRGVHALAAAFQLIHTATLVHDDVIDHAELRRGRASVPRAFGLPAAIVTGDYLFVRAFELAGEYPAGIIHRCGEACAELAEGEILQEAGRFDIASGREHYFRVVERKTAAIVAAALASVAEIVGGSPRVVDAASAYGRSVGIAFQIRDDLLDMYGDPDLLGKPLYSDLREGNPTLVTLAAHASLPAADRAEFARLFGLRRKTTADLHRLRELTDRTDAPAETDREARRWSQRAIEALQLIPPSRYHTLLERVALGVAERRY